MRDINKLIVLNDILNNDNDFTYLLDAESIYYEKQLDKINSNLINNLAKLLIGQFHYKYYEIFDKLVEMGVPNRKEYDYYDKKFLDELLYNIEENIVVYKTNDLKILISILDISYLFMKNALDEKDLDSLLNSFMQLKDKLEYNKFIRNEKSSYDVHYGRKSFADTEEIFIKKGERYVSRAL
ncbi:hypothetical protein [Methanobrevibacter sp.]|uniref:hypothetical protein n=1 Tax=Methanobrevibacter sp. TaxID=66852 RepID=UPI0026E08577|nr:hypothetical protein [Methanobrevibacter sp.]MDO5860810.1 hypothetical protein [Methanobrevibacter sp.]